MATRVSSRFAPHDENAAVTAKSAQKSISAIPTTGLKPRPKLSNITNKIQQQQQQQTPQTRPIKQTPQETCGPPTILKSKKKKQPSVTSTIQQQQKKLPVGPFPISKELEAKAEAWARIDIEKVHFSGDDMEALREKLEREEMSKRVKAVLSFRTEMFPSFRPAPKTEDPFDGEGNLKLDDYESNHKLDTDDNFFGGQDDVDDLDKLLRGDWLVVN